MKKLTTLFILTITASRMSFAQIVPTLTYTPEQLVQNYIVGPGITVTGVTFNGAPGTTLNPQIGFFSGSSSIGLDSGVVITSGVVPNIVGPNNNDGVSMAWGMPSYDTDLMAISAVGVNDPGVLEFDFIPTGDSVSFSFVFGSDEYMEYVGGGINDAFGIFLSGPGISGPYSLGSENIATIPGGAPVSIDNVNMFVNPAYYVDNGDGYTAPYATSPFYIQYDGFTVKLTAKWPVTCGSTYHIKFAIADGYDDVIDSGVFIEAGSFTSSGASVALNVPTVGGAGPNSVFEGCALGSSVDFTFTRPDTTSGDTVFFNIGGNAINGLDYSLISPNYIVYAPGQTSATLTVNVFNDGIIEGTDTLIIEVPGISSCGSFTGTTVTLFINDPYNLLPFAGNDTVYNCPGQTLVFNGITLNGNPPYDYSWSDGTTGSAINYTLTQLGGDTLVLSVTDGCGYTGVDTLFLAQVPPSAPLNAYGGPDLFYTCPGDSSLVTAMATGGVYPYTYMWEGTVPGPAYYYVASSDTVIVLTVTDFCGNTDTDTVLAIQLPPTPLVANAGPDTTLTCAGQTVMLMGSYTGGSGLEMVFWSEVGSMVADNVIGYPVQPLVTTSYVFSVFNNCGQLDHDTVTVIVPPYTPLSYFLSDSDITVNCPGTAVDMTGYATGGGTAPYTYSWSNGDTDSLNSIVASVDDTLAFTITDGCGLDTTIEIPIDVLGGAVELNFPNGRYCRNSDSTALVPLSVTGGHGPYTFTWSAQPGGSVSADSIALTFNITNPVNGYYNLTITDACGSTDTDSGEVIMRDCDLNIPNVMTPNGDGINDVFYIDGLASHPNSILRVYNRWGALVFSDSDYTNDWDGSTLAAGVYFYIIQLTDGTVPSEYHGYLNIFY